jgi:hypothetical protein
MRIKIQYDDDTMNKGKHKYIHSFIKFLHENYPIKNELTIHFLSKRIGNMTTGSRNGLHELKVISKGRLLRDVLRTLAHEWVHEYQLGVLGREMGQDIGGVNEDEANSIAGRLLKIFEKQYPHKEYMMYE